MRITNLPNRRFLIQKLTQVITTARDNGANRRVVIYYLTVLKNIN